jgi:hypothetical protein
MRLDRRFDPPDFRRHGKPLGYPSNRDYAKSFSWQKPSAGLPDARGAGTATQHAKI